jgi:hypothetical protein
MIEGLIGKTDQKYGWKEALLVEQAYCVAMVSES